MDTAPLANEKLYRLAEISEWSGVSVRVLTNRIITGVDGVKLAAIRPDRHFRTSRQALLRWSAAVRGEQVVEVVRPERVTSGHSALEKALAGLKAGRA